MKKNKGELDVLAPMFFNDAHCSSVDFAQLLKSKGMNKISSIFIMDHYQALDLRLVFEEQAKELSSSLL